MIIEGRSLILIYDLNSDEETYALREASIALSEHQITGVVGPSGSGKSSLLYVLAGLRPPTSGTIYYDDRDISLMEAGTLARLRREEFGFIFQRHFLMDYLTAFENVLAALKSRDEESREKVLSTLEVLGVKQLANKKPLSLSVGQRQKIAIARALVNNPSVIFADEPTASLDKEGSKAVMEILHSIKSRTSTIIVTHDLSILEEADRIIEMDKGQISIRRQSNE